MDSSGCRGMVSRIEERMQALGLNRTTLDKAAGLATGFTRDLMAGRKAQPRIGNLERLAAALECPLDYLLNGESAAKPTEEAPGKSTIPEVMIVGYCDAGSWRDNAKSVEPTKSGCYPDPRFAPQHQVAYEIRDGHGAEHGVAQGEVVIALSAEGMGAVGITAGYGDLVVGTQRKSGMSQTKLLLLSGPSHDDVEIDGLVLAAVRRFRLG